MERLQKHMAHCGVASRRKCEELIAEGRVRVNGITVTEAGIKIDPYNDRVEVDGETISPSEKRVYVMLNKPEGYVSTARDQFGRPTVLDLVKEIKERVYPVGRLDYDSGGLLLLTNDGELTYGLTHPRHGVAKTYIATVVGRPTSREINRIKRGVPLDGRITSPADIELVKRTNKDSVYRVIIHEGRNRQVRRMFEKIGYTVISLKRIAIGSLELGPLPSGKWRFLKESEVRGLFKIIKL
ncbi:MAG: pseudouridine synthase [Clostridia bacterium]|nr:rRNA pseudouridine synthase [Clostridiales bacterium]